MRKYALITGGTEGIGLELSKLFAKDNCNLIIVARNKEKLSQIKNEIEIKYNVNVDILSIDISIHSSCEKIIEFVDKKNISVDYLINNAGIGSFGLFSDGKFGFEEKLININIIALTNLTKYFIKQMVDKNSGGIMNIASTAAFVGGPKMAMYYSSKAYVLSLTEALHEEVKNFNVNVSCVCPGPVKTSFQSKAGIKKSKKANKYLMDAEKVAKIAYEEFFKGKAIIIPGYKNKLLVWGTKLIPRSISRKIILKNNN